jgi:sugar transferase (PEP-CTERM system associated)
MSVHRIERRALLLGIAEHLLIVAAVLVSARLRFGAEDWVAFTVDNGYAKSWLIAVVVQLCLHFANLHKARACASLREVFIRVVQGLGAASCCLAVLYFWFPQLMIGRGIFLIATVLIVTITVGGRLIERWKNGPGIRERLLLVGTDQPAVELARELFDRRLELGVEIVGFIDPDPARIGAAVINPGVIGAIDDIPAVAEAHGVSRIVVSGNVADARLPTDKLLKMKVGGVQFDRLGTVYEEYTGKLAIDSLHPSWFIFSQGVPRGQWLVAAKRAFDVVAAIIGLLVGLPLMVLVAVLVKLTSKGPMLYHQTRVGQHGRPFTIHKFRSMRLDAEADTGAVWAMKMDSRVTPIGDFLRSTRLDEMPQLWNVLVGELSLVGPRPERPEFVDELTRRIPYYGDRHVVKPGVTGWAQVRYIYSASVEDAHQKLKYDLFYVKNFSLALDLLIVFDTVTTVLMRRGA